MAVLKASVAERQTPLRSLYRERPESALTTKRGATSSAIVPPEDPFHGVVEIGDNQRVALCYGLDSHVGGLEDLPNPGDLLCAALAACEDGTIRMIANLLGVRLEKLEVEVSGSVDTRGTLMVDPNVQVGFQSLSCRVRLQPAAGTDRGVVDKLVQAAQRSCVNLDTLTRGVGVSLVVDSNLGS